jgi:pimeloyl-ACP methyl ester carboxylesterase
VITVRQEPAASASRRCAPRPYCCIAGKLAAASAGRGQDGRVSDSQDQVAITVTLPDGRTLEALLVGPRDGLPMVFHHGTPGGVAVYPPMVDAAADRGLRVVLYGRPGYGASTPQPGRSVADAATDVQAIADHLDARRFITVGWSGGGPHALACARLLPSRCVAAATLAGVAPYDAAGLDWLAGMAEDNLGEFAAAVAGPEQLTGLLTEVAPLMQELTGEVLADGIGDLASPADKVALRGELADYVAASFRAGLRAGIAGWRDDDLAFVRDWGFSFGVPGGAPVAVWQGDEDRMVPFAHGHWLARQIPAARTHFSRGTGHMHLPFGDVFDELLELAGGR